MVLKELYRDFLIQLQAIYPLREATVITDRIFESIAGIFRPTIIKDPQQPLNDAVISRLQTALAELKKHKPLQYVLGEAWFYGFRLKVNDQVLIPRPETEELVDLLIKSCRTRITNPSVLDIGTGSGCIAIAIKKGLPAADVTAIDISETALAVAKENATHLNTDIRFLKMDFLNEAAWPAMPMYDIIISNPPYIPKMEKGSLARNVLDYEPHGALFVPDEQPFVFYDKTALFAVSHLRPAGLVFMEANERLTEEVKEIFERSFGTVEIKKDMFGKDRMIIACH